MGTLKRLFILCFLALAILVSPTRGQSYYYVSPTAGTDYEQSDSDWGKVVTKPYRTIQRTRDIIRAGIRSGSITGDVIVHLLDGVYFIPETIHFTSEDSGPGSSTITYRNYEATGVQARPLITGGYKITNWYHPTSNTNLWAADYDGPAFRELYVGGNHRTRARHPNEGLHFRVQPGTTGWNTTDWKININMTTAVNSQGSSVTLPALAFPSASPLFETELHLKKQWRLAIHPVESISSVGGGYTAFKVYGPSAIVEFQHEKSGGLDLSAWMSYAFLENSMDFLDVAGEWYYDATHGSVYYIAFPGENPNSVDVYVPRNLDTLFDIRGDVNLSSGGYIYGNTNQTRFVHNLQFVGLRFAHTQWNNKHGTLFNSDYGDIYQTATPSTAPQYLSGGVRHTIPSAVNIQEAYNVKLMRNVFYDLGGGGVSLTRATRNVRVTGNVFRDVGATAISLHKGVIPVAESLQSSGLRANFDEDTIYYNGYTEHLPSYSYSFAAGCSLSNICDNNWILYVGQRYSSSPSIYAGYNSGLVISANQIGFSPGAGIAMGWGFSSNSVLYPDTARNVITNNAIYRACTFHDDTSGIYTFSQGGTPDPNRADWSRITGNYVHDIHPSPWSESAFQVCGMYFDLNAMYYIETNNVYTNITGLTALTWKQNDSRGTNAFLWTQQGAPLDATTTALVITNAGNSTNIVDTGLGSYDEVGRWALDSVAANVTKDMSGFANAATASSTFLISPYYYRNGGASGGFQYSSALTVSDDPSLRVQEFTLMSWVRFADNLSANPSAYPTLMLKEDYGNYLGFGLYFDRSLPGVVCRIGDGVSRYSVSCVKNIPASQWFLVSATFDGHELRIYVHNTTRGVEASGSTTITQSGYVEMKHGSSPVTIGSQFGGYLDDVRIVNKALTEQQILTRAGL